MMNQSTMSAAASASSSASLRFHSLDPEARFGLPTGRGTTPSSLTVSILTLILGGAFYGAAYAFRDGPVGGVIWQYTTGFGQIPIPIVFLSIWSLVFLFIKTLKIRTQKQALRLAFVPEDSGFVLTDATADAVIDAIDRSVDDPSRFLFLARCRAVLRMGSLTPAERVGMEADIGSLAVGKRADILSLDTDLRVNRVFIGGREFR